MADDLFRVFKSVRKLVRERTEDLFGNVTPLEKALREVTDGETCAVSNSLLRQIAVSTNDAFAYSTVAQTVWQGISSDSWQTIYKCLGLLEFMILLGPERCRADCAQTHMTIMTLTQYRYHDGRREQGGGVRQKAENILKLINDESYWRSAKEQAIADTEKYTGGIENQPYVSPMSHMNIHSRATNPFFTGPEAVPPFSLRGRQENPFGGNPFGGSPANPFGSNPVHPFGSVDSNGAAYGGPFGASPFGGGAQQQFRRPAEPPVSTGGFYDPGDDFNTSNPFSGVAEVQQQSESVTKESGSLASNDSKRRGGVRTSSLLDEEDDFFSSNQIPPAKTEKSSTSRGMASNSLLPDLLE